MKKILSLIVFITIGMAAHAQRWSVSTNMIDYAALGTANAEISVGVDRHVSLDLEGRFNPWTFNEGEGEQFQNRNIGGLFGVRYWPWHVFAGWWYRGSAQYERYNRGGLIFDTAEEGEAYGVGFSFGYSLLLTGWLNVDFGIGLWGGQKNYVVYACPQCGRIVEDGQKWFVAPDDLRIAFSIIF